MTTIAIDALDTPIAAALARQPGVDLVLASAAGVAEARALVILSPGGGRDADGSGGGIAAVTGTASLLARIAAAPPAQLVVVSSSLAALSEPSSAVGASRKELESVVSAWADVNDVRCAVVRPGIVVDPSAAGRRWLRRSVWSGRIAVEGRNPRRRFVLVDDVAAAIVDRCLDGAASTAVVSFDGAGVTSAERQGELVGRLVQPTLSEIAARYLARIASAARLSSTDGDVFEAALVDFDLPQPGAESTASDLAWCAGTDEAWWSAKNAHERQMVALSIGGIGAAVLGVLGALSVRWLRRPPGA